MPDFGIGEMLTAVFADTLAADAAAAGALEVGGAAALPSTMAGLTAADIAAASIPETAGALAAGGGAVLPSTMAGLTAADFAAGAVPELAGGMAAGGASVLPGMAGTSFAGVGDAIAPAATFGSDVGMGALKGAGMNIASDLVTGKPITPGGVLQGIGTGGVLGGLGSTADIGGGAPSAVGAAGPGAAASAAPGAEVFDPAASISPPPQAMTIPGLPPGPFESNIQNIVQNIPSSDFLAQAPASGGADPFSMSSVGGAATPSVATTSTLDGKPMLSFGAQGPGTPVPDTGTNLFGGSFLSGNNPAVPSATDASAGAASGGGTSGGSLGSKIASSIFGGSPTDTVNQVAGAAPAVLPLAYQAIAGSQQPKGYNALASEAAQLAAQGQTMQNYLTSGTLPPGLQTAVQSASESAKATIKSQYASRGMSGSSSEAQDLAAVDSRMAGQVGQLALQLYQSGLSSNQTAAQIQQALLTDTIQADAGLGTALGAFTSALAGGGNMGTFQLKVA